MLPIDLRMNTESSKTPEQEAQEAKKAEILAAFSAGDLQRGIQLQAELRDMRIEHLRKLESEARR